MQEELGVSYISKEDIPVKAQDGSLLEFSGSVRFFEAETFKENSLNIACDLETCSRGVVIDRSRFIQKSILQLEYALMIDISKGHHTQRANKKDPSKKFNSIKIN